MTRKQSTGIARDTSPVLVLMTNHHLGNFVVSLPFLEQIARYFSHPVDLVVDSRYACLARLVPSVGTVIPYEQRNRRRGLISQGRDFMSLVTRLIRRRYKLVLDVGGGIQSVTLATLTMAPRRIGQKISRRSWLYSERLEPDPGPHVTDRLVPFLKLLGCPDRPPRLRLRPTPEAVDDLSRYLPSSSRQERKLVVIHPGAGYEFRQWPGDRFAEVADALISRWDTDIVYVGAPGEEPFLQAIISAMKVRDRARTLVADLDVVLALFDRARMLLSNESGPTHLAAATDTPIVTIFGPSKESIWRPLRDDDVTILRGAVCPPECRWGRCKADLKCVMNVSVSDVVKAAAVYLDR